MVSTTVFTLLVLASSAAAVPVQQAKASVSFPLTRRHQASVHILHHDQRRAKNLMNRGNAEHLTARALEPLVNTGVGYTADITIGNSSTIYSLIVDTGSSNTWVGADPNKRFVPTRSSTDTGETVSVQYGSGSFNGEEYIDTVTLLPSLVVEDQSFGAAFNATGFDGVDGILGVGPTDLTANTLSSDNQTIPTLSDNLYAQGSIPSNSIAISFEPTVVPNAPNGEISWGETNPLKHTSSIVYGPITSISPAKSYWGVDMSVAYGGKTILTQTGGIVDTGTTLVLLATDAYNAYKAATGGVEDSTSGLLKLTPEQYAKLSSMYFSFAGTSFELTPNAQTWPRSRNSDIGGSPDFYYAMIGDLGSPSGQGLDFICGYAFLERYYSVYDTTNQRIGLAPTWHTYDEIA